MKNILFLFLFLTGTQFSFAQDSLRGQFITCFKAYTDRPVHLAGEDAIWILANPGSKVEMNLHIDVEASSQWYPFLGDMIQHTTKQEVWFDGKIWKYGDPKIETREYVMNNFGKFAYYLFIGFLILCPFFLEREKFMKKNQSQTELLDVEFDDTFGDRFSYLIHNANLWLMLLFVVVFDLLTFGIPFFSAYIFSLVFSLISTYYWRWRTLEAWKNRPKVNIPSDVC